MPLNDRVGRYIYPPPEIRANFYDEMYFERYWLYFKVERIKLQPFNKTQVEHIKASDEPLFVPISTFKTGVTYVYEADNDILFYRPYCEIASTDLPKFPNIFFFDGTDSSAELVGSFSSRFPSSRASADKCVTGYTLKGLAIFLVEESEPNFNYSELLIMDSSYKKGLSNLYVNVVNLFEPDFVDYVTPSWQGDEKKPFVAVLLSHEETPGYYPEFQFMGLRDPTKQPITLARFPYIEVYAGFLNFSQSNLIVKYVEPDRNTAIPQKFGGKVRTFFVRPRETLVIPMTFANSTVGQWKPPELGALGTAYPGDYLTGAYQPFLGRRGFLRTNWLDGSLIRNYVLELDEPLDNSHFYYTFTFTRPCNDAQLFVTTIINMTEEHSKYYCSDGSFQVISRGLRVELQGDAVVEYSIGDSKNYSSVTNCCLCTFISLLTLYKYTK